MNAKAILTTVLASVTMLLSMCPVSAGAIERRLPVSAARLEAMPEGKRSYTWELAPLEAGEYDIFVHGKVVRRSQLELKLDGVVQPTQELPLCRRPEVVKRLKLADAVSFASESRQLQLHCPPEVELQSVLVKRVQPEKQLQLVWAEEFDQKDIADLKNWRSEIGFLRNEEAQYYTDFSPENLSMRDGCLRITAKRQKFPNPAYDPKSSDWRFQREFAEFTSATVDTWESGAWQYGRIDIRAKVAPGQGVWPAGWTLGEEVFDTNWPDCGEIDIVEYFGKSPGVITCCAHFRDFKSGQHAMHGDWAVNGGFAIENEFNVYSVIWDENAIQWLINDKPCFEYRRTPGAPWQFDRPQYVILNQAMGGIGGGPVDPLIETSDFDIDYVRVWQ